MVNFRIGKELRKGGKKRFFSQDFEEVESRQTEKMCWSYTPEKLRRLNACYFRETKSDGMACKTINGKTLFGTSWVF